MYFLYLDNSISILYLYICCLRAYTNTQFISILFRHSRIKQSLELEHTPMDGVSTDFLLVETVVEYEGNGDADSPLDVQHGIMKTMALQHQLLCWEFYCAS